MKPFKPTKLPYFRIELRLVLIWVYYSVVIFLFGAQITYYIAENVGGNVTPSAQAVKVELIELDENGDFVNYTKKIQRNSKK